MSVRLPMRQIEFVDLWMTIGARGNGFHAWDELFKRYREPHRAYHTGEHVGECIHHLRMNLERARNPDLIEFALYYHDAVYDITGTDNEQASADLATRVCHEAQLSSEITRTVRELILATRHDGTPLYGDAALIADIDLAIFAAPWDEFLEYDHAIYTEYVTNGGVPEALYRTKRPEVLAMFNARDSIYHTSALRAQWEAKAHENLTRLLQK